MPQDVVDQLREAIRRARAAQEAVDALGAGRPIDQLREAITSAKPMRALSGRQALTCENATSVRCRCRCGGALHGTARSRLPEYFEQLDEEDPHWVKQKSRQLPLPAPVGAVA